jgi:methylenetetrahydrofolate reductase (NADPH)
MNSASCRSHIPRRLQSQEEPSPGGLQRRSHHFAAAPPQPMGPYDALSIIRSGLLGKFGIQRVGISGYPEGHPDIGNDRLWQAKLEKQQAI